MRRISPLSWLLILVGVVFLVVGVIYLTTTAPDLPGFIPGHVAHVKHARKYSKRGIAAIVVAVAAFAGVFYNDFRSR
jgi:amino acid permease